MVGSEVSGAAALGAVRVIQVKFDYVPCSALVLAAVAALRGAAASVVASCLAAGAA